MQYLLHNTIMLRNSALVTAGKSALNQCAGTPNAIHPHVVLVCWWRQQRMLAGQSYWNSIKCSATPGHVHKERWLYILSKNQSVVHLSFLLLSTSRCCTTLPLHAICMTCWHWNEVFWAIFAYFSDRRGHTKQNTAHSPRRVLNTAPQNVVTSAGDFSASWDPLIAKMCLLG